MSEPDQLKAMRAYVAALASELAPFRDDIGQNVYGRTTSALDRASQHLAAYPSELLQRLRAETEDPIQVVKAGRAKRGHGEDARLMRSSLQERSGLCPRTHPPKAAPPHSEFLSPSSLENISGKPGFSIQEGTKDRSHRFSGR
jgi:hypothetical protein